MKKIVCLLLLFIALASFNHRPLTWVAIGDSITYFNDHLDRTGDRLTKGYLTRVTERLPYIHYVNQGYSGWTTGEMARNFDKLGIPAADVYTILLGTNDWWHSNPLGAWKDYANNTGDSTIFGAFRVIIDKIHHLNKDAAIILITPMPRGDFVQINNPKNNAYGSYKPKDGQTLEQVATAILAIASLEHFKVLDLYHEEDLAIPHLVRFKHLKDPQTGKYKNYVYPDYASVSFDPATDEYPYPPAAIGMTYDGLHPSDQGSTVIAKRLARIMKQL